MARKKVILFIVEGLSDQTALEGSLRNIYKPNDIKFCIVRTDITSDTKVNKRNIKSKIGDLIKNQLNREPYNKSDILKVIHFTDMDGAYVKEDKIIEDSSKDKFYYNEDSISGKSKVKILERNNRKSENLDALSQLPKVYGTLEYSLYYFSCDQEHVLHNKTNVATPREKEELAETFNEKYEDNFEEFKEFIFSTDLKAKGNYKESWEFIKNGTNSLKRYTNLSILLEKEGCKL